MEEVEKYIDNYPPDCKYIKIPIEGVVTADCFQKSVIYDSQCFESFGTIHFENIGRTPVEIFKNKLPNPVAVVNPKDTFTLTSNPLFRIEVKCKPSCNPQAIEKEVFYEKRSQKRKSKATNIKRKHSKSFKIQENSYNSFCEDEYYLCKLCYSGFVCIEIDCDVCGEIIHS